MIRARLVDALGSVSTDLAAFRALVNVLARTIWLSTITLGTGAVADSTGDFDALGSVRTLLAS